MLGSVVEKQVAVAMTHAPPTATTTSQVKILRKQTTNSTLQQKAPALVKSGVPLNIAEIEQRTFYELGAYLTEMKKVDAKVRLGSDIKQRRKNAGDFSFFQRNGVDSWEFQKEETDI